MLVQDAIRARLTATDGAPRVRLPGRLKTDRISTRISLFQRLAANRLFAFGDRAGALKSAERRSGRAFKADVRQRVIVKALVSRHTGHSLARGAVLAAHVAYLGRSGAGVEGAKPAFFDRETDARDASLIAGAWAADRHHFRFIISPEHGDRIADLRGYAREVMRRVSEDLGEPQLEWLGVCHFDTDQPHAHVLVRGIRASGKDLVIPRDYVAFGFRARAQEVAQELLGDLSRADAERRIWRETQADRFTGFDRRLLQACDAARCVPDGLGATDAWAALSRGRLRHLEQLGLAVRVGDRYRLDPEMEPRLRRLQLQRDIIRTLQQRRLEVGRQVSEAAVGSLRGRVVRAGFHDELGGVAYVIVRDVGGIEHYARLRFADRTPRIGSSVELLRTEQGAYAPAAGRWTGDRGRGG